MRFSITSDMFNYSFKPGMAEKLGFFSEHGFEFLHWCDNWDDDVAYTGEEMRHYAGLIEDAGLRCLDVHGTATQSVRIDSVDSQAQKAYVKLLRNRVEFCSAVGGDAVVVHPPRYHEPGLQARLRRASEALSQAERLCATSGVRLALENCYPDDHRVLRSLFEEHDPEFLSYCYDSGHANIHRNLPQLKEFRDRLVVTHLHDNRGDADSHQPPGWGTVDWTGVVDWLRGYAKPLNLEVTHRPEHYPGTMKGFMEEAVASLRLLVGT